MVDGVSDDEVRSILTGVSTIAVVGASPNPARPSNDILGFLIAKGFETFPVNPGRAGGLIRGRLAYARLADVPAAIDMVDVFRNSAAAGRMVDEALRLDPLPRVIWMQLGVVDEAAAKRARAKGVTVVMNRCPRIEFRRLVRSFARGPRAASVGVGAARRPTGRDQGSRRKRLPVCSDRATLRRLNRSGVARLREYAAVEWLAPAWHCSTSHA
jgi:uncharacterized protein